MSYNETLEHQYLRSIPQQGKVEWIGIRTKRIAEVHSVSEVNANPDWRVITSRNPPLANAK